MYPWQRISGIPTLALLASLAWFCPRAEAQTPPASGSSRGSGYQLTWQAAPNCPSGAHVSREISDLTADSASSRQVIAVEARAVVTNDADGFTMTLTLRSAGVERSRHIGAPTCEELGHAAALIVALAVDPTLLERRAATGEFNDMSFRDACHCRLTELPLPPPAAEPPPPPVVIGRPCPSPDVIAPLQTQTIPTRREPLFWRLGLGTFGTYRTLPGANLGVSLLGGFQARRVRLDVALSTLSTTVHSSGESRSADLSLYRVAPRACWLFTNTTSWSAGPCASVEIGILAGKGHAADLVTSAELALWLASSFGGVVEVRLASSALLLLSADLGVPWLRNDGFLLGGETVHRAKTSGTFGMGLAVGWP